MHLLNLAIDATARLVIVLGLILLVFAVAVMQSLFSAVIAGLLLLLGLMAVHGCFCQLFHRVDQIFVRLVRAQWKAPPYLLESTVMFIMCFRSCSYS